MHDPEFIPVPDVSLKRSPTENEKIQLRTKLHELLRYRGAFQLRQMHLMRSSQHVIISLQFMSRIDMDLIWCAFLRAQFLPERGLGWLARPVMFDPLRCEVFLEPIPDAMERLLAHDWAKRAGENPIVEARLRFIGVQPSRNLSFRILH